MTPSGASAEWKRDNIGWWYTEGNSYYKDQWALIDGKWYYFDMSGYLFQDMWVYDGNYVNANGEWTGLKAKYSFGDIVNHAWSGHTETGNEYYLAGDKGPLSVVNGEPCVYTWDKNDEVRFIGMNTLNVYNYDDVILDKVVF